MAKHTPTSARTAFPRRRWMQRRLNPDEDMRMVSLPRRLDKLEDDLNALAPEYDAMLLGELDGFIAAMVVCPVEIPAEEWLGHLSRDVAEDGVTKLDMSVVEALVPDILDHYRRVSLELKAGDDSYMPVYYTDPDDGSVAWQPWAAGFGEGMQLRMEIWSAAATDEDEDEGVLAALVGLMAAVSVAHGVRPEDLGGEEEGVDFPAMMAEAADLLPFWVETLFDWRYALRPDPVQAPVRVAHIGRNDPCPCGSGRKHKKCCGAAGAA